MSKRRKDDVASPIKVYLCISMLSTVIAFSMFPKQLWIPLIVGVATFIATCLIHNAYQQYTQSKRKQTYRASMLADVDHLSGKSFEEYLQVYFEDRGYTVDLTPDTNDYGADLIMYKDGVKTVVQAKRYKKQVGIAAIQQAIGAKEYYSADKAMVCTNSYFSESAKQLAEHANVELWDRNTLLKKRKEG